MNPTNETPTPTAPIAVEIPSTNPFETAALQLLQAAIGQFSVLGVTALMNLLTNHINANGAKS